MAIRKRVIVTFLTDIHGTDSDDPVSGEMITMALDAVQEIAGMTGKLTPLTTPFDNERSNDYAGSQMDSRRCASRPFCAFRGAWAGEADLKNKNGCVSAESGRSCGRYKGAR